jgi:hypothetical protein
MSNGLKNVLLYSYNYETVLRMFQQIYRYRYTVRVQFCMLKENLFSKFGEKFILPAGNYVESLKFTTCFG